MPIYKKTVNLPLSQLIRLWRGEEKPDWAKSHALVKESVAYALRKRPEGIAFLKSCLDSDDLREQGQALWFLSRKEICDEETVGHLIHFFRKLAEQETKFRFAFKEFALDGLMAVEQYPLERSEVKELLFGESVEAKDAAAKAMVYLSRAFPEDVIDILRDGLNSINPAKRHHACTESGFRNIIELRDEVQRLQIDQDSYVSRGAKIGMSMFAMYEYKAKTECS